MLRVAAELQDVPLADPHVFQKPPGRMRHAGRLGPTDIRGQASDGLFEIEVRTATSQQVEHVFAQLLVVVHVTLSAIRIASRWFDRCPQGVDSSIRLAEVGNPPKGARNRRDQGAF